MIELITLFIATVLLLIGAIVVFLIAISKKHMPLFYLAILLFFSTLGTGTWTGFRFLEKSYKKVDSIFKPRTGEEIYTALFDGNPNKCTQILEKQDQVIPKIDIAIYLHFKSCPTEIERILSLHSFEIDTLLAKDILNSTIDPHWFKPKNLSDTILVYHYNKDELGNGQTHYVSKEKDEVFCKDIWD